MLRKMPLILMAINSYHIVKPTNEFRSTKVIVFNKSIYFYNWIISAFNYFWFTF
ncbi:hypothetical protein RPAGB_1367 [Rickettsia parkeri str. Grand Bay]|nr:hypothetical protein RPAGB_1367 [Rickettsia parkeri str. Grand Bay]